jgi:rhamnose utilization protein RhaD (predicted bifunctional aldolase and dehydrogenase)/NAD(P)-dependent dehydrogenase (short-subunit alcohol dehydrogenase family)
VKNLWNDEEAVRYFGDLPQRVYSSRLLGADSSLVLHGGGNTSVKSEVTNVFGEAESVLYVKGSGWDLVTIEAAGFSPCRMQHLLRLAGLQTLSDAQMAVELKKSLTDINAPMPSVEAILHAIIPARFVDHTHADAILTMTNSPDGEQRVRKLFGEQLVYIPYVMPGFKLARLCAELYPQHAGKNTIGMLLLNHGLFTFGETAKSAYDRMIELVTRAEEYLAERKAWNVRVGLSKGAGAQGATPSKPGSYSAPLARADIAALRKNVSVVAGHPMILAVHEDEEALGFTRRADLADLTQQGPATPDHVLRTKRIPLIGRDVEGYARAYGQYFKANADSGLTMLDAAPRVILDPGFGFYTVGRTAKDAAIVEDIYRHTMVIEARAAALGGWRALPQRDIFEVEYWDLEQAKLRKGGAAPVFTGEIALVTGAASGIGKACVTALLARGAAVVGVDVSSAVVDLHRRKDYLGLQCDLTNDEAVRAALDQGVKAYGGLDMLILNAGIFPASAPIASLSSKAWHKTMSINLDANLLLLRECHALLRLAPRSGRVVVIGSKNVAAPGPGAAAYSASKAAMQQVARVAALEWGTDHIRINTLHPNAVFDTGIWTPEVLASRASSYHMTVEQYKTNNVLGVEITSKQVAELAAEMCGPAFAGTTGAQIPIDGGNERVI